MKNMKQARQQGFTLIELMIVIAIVGILSAVALPAYQDYTERAKLTEALAAAGAAKTSVSEYYMVEGSIPASLSAAGLDANPPGDMVKLQAVNSSTGVITLTLSSANGDVNGKTLTFTPETAGGTIISWSCGAGTTPTKYLPANCRG